MSTRISLWTASASKPQILKLKISENTDDIGLLPVPHVYFSPICNYRTRSITERLLRTWARMRVCNMRSAAGFSKSTCLFLGLQSQLNLQNVMKRKFFKKKQNVKMCLIFASFSRKDSWIIINQNHLLELKASTFGHVHIFFRNSATIWHESQTDTWVPLPVLGGNFLFLETTEHVRGQERAGRRGLGCHSLGVTQMLQSVERCWTERVRKVPASLGEITLVTPGADLSPQECCHPPQFSHLYNMIEKGDILPQQMSDSCFFQEPLMGKEINTMRSLQNGVLRLSWKQVRVAVHSLTVPSSAPQTYPSASIIGAKILFNVHAVIHTYCLWWKGIKLDAFCNPTYHKQSSQLTPVTSVVIPEGNRTTI